MNQHMQNKEYAWRIVLHGKIGYADDNEARKGSCTPSMVNKDFLILPHNDRFRQTSWLFHWTARKKKSCTSPMVNEEKFFHLTEELETCLSE